MINYRKKSHIWSTLTNPLPVHFPLPSAALTIVTSLPLMCAGCRKSDTVLGVASYGKPTR